MDAKTRAILAEYHQELAEEEYQDQYDEEQRRWDAEYDTSNWGEWDRGVTDSEARQLEEMGWYWGQFVDWDEDSYGNQYIDGYYEAWEKVEDNRVYHAFTLAEALDYEKAIAKQRLRKPLLDAGVLKPSPGQDGDFVWACYGNYWNIGGAWFGELHSIHLENQAEGLW